MALVQSDAFPEDLSHALRDFSQAAEKRLDSFARDLEAAPPPDLIYHYTNDQGLRGILQAGRVWLSNAFKLNDPAEVAHGFSRLVKALNTAATGGSREVELFASQIADFGKVSELQRMAHLFVCSFSTAGDDLSQWRAYADNGRGFSVAFDAHPLEQTFSHTAVAGGWSSLTFPVKYSEAELDEIQVEFARMALPLISLPKGRKLSSEEIRNYIVELQTTVSLYGVRAALFFKHGAYTNESEYRFLEVHGLGPVPDLRVRSRPYSLIEYREFDWRKADPKSLKRIVIGPAADRDRAVQFARDCLRECGAEGVEIVHSDIPYRAA